MKYVYILKGKQQTMPHFGDTLRANYPEINKPVGKVGPFTTVAGTGKFDKSQFCVRVVRHDSKGEYLGSSHAWATDAASLKKVLRKIRPEEAEALTAIDDELKALRVKRDELLRVAWAKGHVVTLSEVQGIACDTMARSVRTGI